MEDGPLSKRKSLTRRAPDPVGALGGGGTAASQGQRAHALRAVRQFAWLEVDSVKVAWSRPAHQRVSREDHTGRAASR
jgi:hypothetical protein